MTDKELARDIRDQFRIFHEMMQEANDRDMSVTVSPLAPRSATSEINSEDEADEFLNRVGQVVLDTLGEVGEYHVTITRRVEF